MGNKNDLNKLVRAAAKGDAESMFQVAVLCYWGYDCVKGVQTHADMFQLLAAAGVNGDAAMDRKIGDFFRYEFQEEKALYHYEECLRKNLLSAAQGDADAQFALCEQYAFGIGVPQDHEKACFWCRVAAQNGQDEAIAMLENFWQDGGVLPVDPGIAKHRGKDARSKDDAFLGLREAVIEQETTRQLLEAERKYLDTKPKKYTLVDKSDNFIAKCRNGISSMILWLCVILFVGYFLVSVFSYLATFFGGYGESGFLHTMNEIFYVTLGIPGKFFLSLFSKLKMSEISITIFCHKYESAGLIAGAIQLVLCAVGFVLWYLLIGGVLLVINFIVDAIFEVRGMKIDERELSKKDASALKGEIDALEKRAAEAEKKLFELTEEASLSSEFRNGIRLLGLLDFASCNHISDLKDAEEQYRSLSDRSERTAYPIALKSNKGAYSVLGLYFILRQIKASSKDQREIPVGFCCPPRYNFDPDGRFMKAHLAYRQGKDFAKPESEFRLLLEDPTASDAEKGWSAWFLSCMYRSEKLELGDGGYQRKYNEECLRQAQIFERTAAKYGCSKAMVTDLCLLWQFDIGTLTDQSLRRQESQPKWSAFFKTLAKLASARISECGNPLHCTKWNDYETKCIWPVCMKIENIYQKAYSEYDRTRLDLGEAMAYRTMLEQLTPLTKELRALKGKGLKRADTLVDSVERTIEVAKDTIKTAERCGNSSVYGGRKVTSSTNVAAARQREEAIKKEMEEYNARVDSAERGLNMWIYGSYATEQERYLADETSQNDYLASAMLRDAFANRHREEFERDYDAVHTNGYGDD